MHRLPTFPTNLPERPELNGVAVECLTHVTIANRPKRRLNDIGGSSNRADCVNGQEPGVASRRCSKRRIRTRIEVVKNSAGQASRNEAKANQTMAAMEDLVRRAVTGDHTAFQQIYFHCSPRVHAVMVRMVGRQDAEDLTQQVFLKLLRKLEKFSGRSQLETWLYRLAVNEALQFLRREKRRRTLALPSDPEDSREDSIEKRELLDQLRLAIAQLEPQLRAILTLKEDAGLSYREIAKAVGIPEGTVGSRLNRARAELRRQL
jgi:RNA polymerase sigma-70 factor (ECF subfamily)